MIAGLPALHESYTGTEYGSCLTASDGATSGSRRGELQRDRLTVAVEGGRVRHCDLYDDFGMAVGPPTDAASIIYSDDRYFEYNHTSNCTAAQDNTVICDHTNVATGTTRIYGYHWIAHLRPWRFIRHGLSLSLSHARLTSSVTIAEQALDA